MKRALFPLTALAILACASGAGAAPSEGERLFREGRAAMVANDYERACALLAESQKKEPAPGTALNLGECEERRGHLVAAGDAFTTAAATFAPGEKRSYAAERAKAADQRTPRLVVRAAVPIPGLVVQQGESVLSIDADVKMDPGEVMLLASAPGRRPKMIPVKLDEGQRLEVDVGELEDVTSDAAPPAPDAQTASAPGGGHLRTIGLVVGGVGAASLAAGTITGLLALDRASTVEQRCTPDLVCDAEGLDAAQSGSTLSLVSTITVVAGSAALAAGALLFFLAPRAPKTTAAVLLPIASRDGAGVNLRASF